MRLPCPHCGVRDRREFTYQGAALARPDSPDWGEAWDDYLHNRDNPAGETRDLWYHDPCGTWLVVTRDTVSHAVHGAAPAAEGGA
ncbi:sarcosine oxidase, delta subunit family protein [Oceanicola granulosus HTCC2516]|uniref:Sarcosine oxidase, delta subunit family protein n=1 Tax=Oceanicola granulosus (strain ATCC BAA-861 / DSM 15982 / KCTC 12143 / HTCC2516) TaxID=314256 RepID=Q2CDB6_OCEGH|nr:sarcosine oxidase subunit delta [Oceanicola granulosus]EAR50674.1 sarcosine oxidase, delta subunit family protein [Oceanicola granulosus HTCC2516]